MGTTDPPFALYQRIKQYVIREIETGNLSPGDRVPSEIRLADTFGASRMTANRALKELTEEGRIIRVQGVGTFVARPKPEAALLKIKSIAAEIAAWGGSHSAEIICLEAASLCPEIGAKMGLRTGDPVFHSILVHRDRGVPVQHSERYVNPAVAPRFLDQDFLTITPSDYLLETAPVQEAEHEIEAVQAGSDLGALLEVEPASPCIRLTRRTWAFDQVATYSILTSPGRRYSLKGRFQRG